jgi:SIR2-like domain
MLFLGAGASKPMDIDDLSGITLRVKELVTPRFKAIIEQLDFLFKENQEVLENFKIDIEVLLTIFNCLVNRKQTLNELGPFALLMHHFVRNTDKFEGLKVTDEEFRSFKQSVASTLSTVISAYYTSEERKSRAMQLYDELFNMPIRNNHVFPNALGGNALPIFKFVATVNYDLVLEIYGRKSNVPGVPKFLTRRGFVEDNGVQVLNIPAIREGDLEPEYIKLHGSIDWWWSRDQRKVISVPDGPGNPYEVLADRTIIYPIYEKHVTQDPFFTLYEYFRKRIFRDDIVIVMGYSFRDVSINNTFLDWLQSKRTSRLIIVARTKNQRFIEEMLANNPRIQFVSSYFGERRFVDDLEDRLRNPVNI